VDTLGRSAKIHIAPRARTVQRGHQFLERVENVVRHVVSDSTIFTHLESLDDPTGWDDVTLNRGLSAAEPKD
jgi:hypothetical protein